MIGLGRRMAENLVGETMDGYMCHILTILVDSFMRISHRQWIQHMPQVNGIICTLRVLYQMVLMKFMWASDIIMFLTLLQAHKESVRYIMIM